MYNLEKQRAARRASYWRYRESILLRAKACRVQNPEKFSAQRKAWRQKNADAVKEQKRIVYIKDRDANLVRAANYRASHREDVLRKKREDYHKNRARYSEYKHLRYLNNREVILEKSKEYAKKHKSQRNSYQRARFVARPDLKILQRLRNALNAAIRGKVKKTARATELLGCSVESFLIYIESKFEPNMSWANYGHAKGKWNLDHIVPCSLFDFSNTDHQKVCFHFSNMQPMWSEQSISKGGINRMKRHKFYG